MALITKPAEINNGDDLDADLVQLWLTRIADEFNGNIDNANIKNAAAIAWSKISKVGSNLTDMVTRSHTDLTDKGTNTHAQIDTHVGATTGAHGISGLPVGDTDTQGLSNKTMTTPVMASFYQDAGKTKLMTAPDTASDTLAALNATQAMANKTLTLPVINGGTVGAFYDNGNGGANKTIDWDNGIIQKMTCDSIPTALAWSNTAAGKRITLQLIQSAAGSKTVTWPATVKWEGGTAPTLTTTGTRKDIICFWCDGTNEFGQVYGMNYT